MMSATDFIAAIVDSRNTWKSVRFGGKKQDPCTYRQSLQLLTDCVDDLELDREPTGAEFAEWHGPDARLR
jgi:hypothetical protein